MKAGAFLINTSRGTVLDEDALCTALRSGHLGGAALDVRATEPPTKGLLEELDNVLLSPHIAAFSREAQKRVSEDVVSDVLAVLAGETPRWPAP